MWEPKGETFLASRDALEPCISCRVSDLVCASRNRHGECNRNAFGCPEAERRRAREMGARTFRLWPSKSRQRSALVLATRVSRRKAGGSSAMSSMKERRSETEFPT